MKVYTYSEATQRLARLLDEAQKEAGFGSSGVMERSSR